MLSSLLCGANPATMPEPEATAASLAPTPAPPALTGDYRVRPRMSMKRTNTASSLRTLMGKKSRDSFCCSDAQQVELDATDAREGVREGAREGAGRRWWWADRDRDGSDKVSWGLTKLSSEEDW